ncbi:gliding motility protein GldL [Phnomibacter sp. MR]|uniref:type IX secretion system motor protein PorL/GldL n=1 Tax=Phnomibacter sp. MR TaxID=3042318 RepID=UPI003A7F9DDC
MAAKIPPKVSKWFDVGVSIAAAVVIYGALQKLLHSPYADLMLKIGLTVESAIFLGYGLLYILYPYMDDHEMHLPKDMQLAGPPNALQPLDEMLKKADITPTNLQKLSDGFQKLGSTVDKMGEIGDVVKSTGDFSANTKAAADAMNNVKGAMDKTVGAMNSFNTASESTAQFHAQVQTLTKNLSELNAVYQLELQDSNNHLKTMNQYFSNLTAVSSAMGASIEDAKQAQSQIQALAGNLAKLNSVYGNMLTAMQGRA